MEDKIKLLIEASNNYYNGRPTGMDDKSYDLLRKEVEESNPGFNLFDHLTIDGPDRTTVVHYYPYIAQEFKLQFSSQEELADILKKYVDYSVTVKLDGCSISAYYNNGELFDIVTRSDEYSGKRKFSQLKNKVPNTVSSEVIKIDFEAVCSKEDYDDDTRSNANGLINSCYKQEEVDKNIVLIPFRVYTKNKMNYLDSFYLAGFDTSDIPYANTLSYDNRYYYYKGKHYPIDGIVFYDPNNNLCNHKIFKYYSNQNVSTTVRKIYWTFSDKLSWTPKLQFDPVKVDGRTIRQCTSNGYARLSSMKAGVGAEITIILANSTIPQVGKVITPSEDYDLIEECPYCHSKMELVNDKLRCSNKFCTIVFERIYNQFIDRLNNYTGLSLRKNINNNTDLVNYYNSLSEEDKSLIDSSTYNIGKFVSESLIIERLSDSRRGEISSQINNHITNYTGDIKSLFVDLSLTWNQYQVFNSMIDIYSCIITNLFRKFKNEVS